MDVIRTEDRAVCTDIIGDRYKDSKEMKNSVSCSTVTKTEKKKSESKKLKMKLSEIEERNESLAKSISEKNDEIMELKKSVNSLNEVLNSVPINELRCNSSIASSKLLDLSKKNRQLRAELEKTKNRLVVKDQQIQNLEKKLQTEQEKNPISKNSNPANIEEMQTKLSALQQKLFETRNKNLELNSQLKLAQKCLQQEIGESFNLNLLAANANSSNWRGRAQQILHLQQKVKELQERLDGNKQNELTSEGTLNFANSPLCSSLSLGSIERPCVRKTEIQHRAKVESLEKDITNLKNELDEHRVKILALKVRNKTLNDEISRYKLKASSLEEQTDYNNFNVATMNDRLNQQKLQYEKRIDELSRGTEKMLKEKKEMELHTEHLKEKIKELEGIILNKDFTIEELNLLVKKLEQDLKALCGDFLFSCREFRKEEFITILDSLEADKNSLLELNKTLNERLTQERTKNDNLIEQASKQKIRVARLEGKLRELERELESQSEKKKRTQRIAEYSASLGSVGGSSSSLSSFTFENTSLTVSVNSNNADPQTTGDLNDLKNRLELTKEKNSILKEKLDYILAEKENDVKTFHEIINKSKQALVEMIIAHHRGNTIEELQ